MKEYINREKLIAEYDRVHVGPAGGARKLMVDAPTADVVEVRHGNAICGDHDEWWGAVYECSLCREKWMLESSSYKAHYCPWCGAKMDGERKEQE